MRLKLTPGIECWRIHTPHGPFIVLPGKFTRAQARAVRDTCAEFYEQGREDLAAELRTMIFERKAKP